MSEQKHTPGTGIHPEDLNALTEYWHRETNYINDKVDTSFKSAQDDAYARGYRRGREDMIIIRKQRDELLAALEEICWSRPLGFRETKYSLAVEKAAAKAIASVKGSAA